MNRTASAILVAALAAALPTSAAAQSAAPRDTLVFSAPADAGAYGDSPVAETGATREPSRWGTPFAVETRGRPVARRVRGEVVRVGSGSAPAEPEAAPADSGAAPASPAEPRPDAVKATRAAAAAAAARTAARADSGASRRAAPRAAAPPRPTGRTHTVAAGETLFGIARRYNVTTAQLRALNPGAETPSLEIGTVLRLPPAARTAPRSQPTRTAPRPARRTHTVVRGETLFGIARRYGVSADAIMRANAMERDQVRIGETLTIP